MNMMALLIFLFAIQIICLLLARKATSCLQTTEDYYLAGREISFFPLMMTFVATQVGGGLILGSAEEAYRYGWSVLVYPLGAVIGLLMLAFGVGRRLASFPVSTVAQILELSTGSKKLKQVASLLSILSLFMIFVAQLIASKKLLASFGIESTAVFLAFWGIVIFYTTQGGLKAVAATDSLQALFFLLVFSMCLILALCGESSPIEIAQSGISFESFEWDQNKLVGWLFMPLFFMLIEQDMAQRCFAAKSDTIVSKATFWAALLTLGMSLIPIYFGILAKIKGITIAPGSSVLMESLGVTVSPIVAAAAGCAVLVAIISTADSLINAVSSNLALDFSFFEKKSLYGAKILSFFIAFLGMGISFFFENVVDVLIISYELSVSCLFVPIMVALFRGKSFQGNSLSSGLSLCFGICGFTLFRLVDFSISKEIGALIISLLGFLIGEIIILNYNKLVKFG